MFIKDNDTLICCNVCGCLLLIEDFASRWNSKTIKCFDCKIEYFEKTITPKMKRVFHDINITNLPIIYKSPNTREFYEQKSNDEFDSTDHWYEIFIREEVSKLPTYSPEKGRIEMSKYLDREKRKAERAANPQPAYTPPRPKCPTCGSTNIQKISDLRKAGGAILFGIFSKDAKSQFECRNCGYKF